MTKILTQGLEQRQQKINVAKDFLSRTQSLFDEFGSAKLRTSHARFAELLDALNADAIRLVVLGEFSRGKSSLVNALLGIELLPTALQATTAINTFIRMLPADRSERFIRIHFQDGRPVQEVPWNDDLALERWGTELDESHADVRQTLDYIEAFMDHPLLEKGLVLVDTPGLETVIKHHEAITRKAIAEAHIALWVQNTTQLGGAATEWEFLTDTLRNNFRKFVTVIGWWDKVLAPDDARERRVPVDQRIQEKLDVVRQNFRRHLKDDEEFKLLTDRHHLIPVSAHWAMDSDPDKRSQSGIEMLSLRIAEMFSSGEALEQIYSKPMQHMTHIQQQLAETLQDELQQLESDKSLEERARELAQFDLETQLLEQEADAVARDSREEHERAARALVENIQRELISPLAELKADIENQVDTAYVERQIKKRVKTVTLPDDLHEQFQAISVRVGDAWNWQKQELSKVLDGLSVDYSKQMEKHAGRLRGEMSKMDVQMPSLDTQFTLDFSAIEQHHQQAMALEQQIVARQEQIESIESDMSKYTANSAQLELARQALSRAERMHDNLGTQPSPKMSSRREVVKKGGMYSDDTYGDVPYTDHSNVQAWKDERDKLMTMLADKEQRLEQIIAEEERKTGLRMTLEKAQKKYEREVATFEKKKAQFEQQSEAAEGQLIRDTTQRLIKNTAGQLEQRIRHLENHVKDAVQKVFADQLQALQDCVKEQYLEPLNAKLEKRREIHSLLEQGKLNIAQRRTRLEQASKEVDDLMTLTQNALKA
ncbi:dynamin family protein [Pseudomonas sp. 21LCFQ02]|uniref:dynamin family protein n=1 Tax=Pseudomonas sp. 21LCFQ02 TaxID=2957505 RepID=UPI00209B09BF|nr:dynamin family protein [Pseudomonas sp. 21LCFQ02]MCO8166743.1 dynamin family protein [Pseudomonas sp. 21LCFQ02]